MKKNIFFISVLSIILILSSNVSAQINEILATALSAISNETPALTNANISPLSNEALIFTNGSMSILSNETPVLTNVIVSPLSNEEPVLTNASLSPPSITESNDSIFYTEELPPDTLHKEYTKPDRQIALMGEFGLGNVFSFYGTYKLNTGLNIGEFDMIHVGAGGGYLFYNDKDNDTSINVIGPCIAIMTKNDTMIFRIRTGIDFISEKRFGFKATTTRISPDVMVLLKGLYAGMSLPIIIGKEGTGVAFAIGVGYQYILSF